MILLVIIIIAVVNSYAPTQDLPDWVIIAGIISLYTLPLGTFLVALGVRLKNKADSFAAYGVVVGTGAAMILNWLWWWGVPLFRSWLFG